VACPHLPPAAWSRYPPAAALLSHRGGALPCDPWADGEGGPGMLTEREVAEPRIRRVIELWALARDAGDWASFAAAWHEDGWMTATWFQGPAADFIAASRAGFDAGVSILHFLGGTRCQVAGRRAVAQTKMTIQQRASVHGSTADVTCTGRFYDFLAERAGTWPSSGASPSTRRTGWTRSTGHPAHPRPRPAGPVPGRLPAPGLPPGPAGLPDRPPAARAARA
jgi:SnoaL-like domain